MNDNILNPFSYTGPITLTSELDKITGMMEPGTQKQFNALMRQESVEHISCECVSPDRVGMKGDVNLLIKSGEIIATLHFPRLFDSPSYYINPSYGHYSELLTGFYMPMMLLLQVRMENNLRMPRYRHKNKVPFGKAVLLTDCLNLPLTKLFYAVRYEIYARLGDRKSITNLLSRAAYQYQLSPADK